MYVRVQEVGVVFSDWPQLLLVYHVLWAVFCVFVPIFILVACNVCLVRALRQSHQLQRLCRADQPPSTAECRPEVTAETMSSGHQHRITPTLIALIVVYVVCVSPSALLFVIGVGDPKSGLTTNYNVHQTATVIANWLYLVNFAVNFILYCVVNVRFRRTARDVLCYSLSPTEEMTDRRTVSHDLVSMVSR